jgi:hypothetical protein
MTHLVEIFSMLGLLQDCLESYVDVVFRCSRKVAFICSDVARRDGQKFGCQVKLRLLEIPVKSTCSQ